MRISLSYTALSLALLAGTTAANAQTVVTRQITDQPVETIITQQPVQTVRTVTTTQTVRPIHTAARTVANRRTVTTRRTITSERVVPAVPAPALAATYPQPLYDVATPLYGAAAPAAAPSLFDTTVPVADTMAPPAYTGAVNNPIPTYRYVYEPDRILVIDPATNIAIQAIPR
jgi:hypothetical protein